MGKEEWGKREDSRVQGRGGRNINEERGGGKEELVQRSEERGVSKEE